MWRFGSGTTKSSFFARSSPVRRTKVTEYRWRVSPVCPTKSSIGPRKFLPTWRPQNSMLKANRDWPKPRFSGAAQSGRKKQNRSLICSITGPNELGQSERLLRGDSHKGHEGQRIHEGYIRLGLNRSISKPSKI